ncbi:MAG: magnesium transporter CorA family protein [Anaerolineae bacterium]
MITIFKSTELGLETINDFRNGSWVNLVDPTPEEIARLHQEVGIPLDFITYPLDIDERARTEKEDNVLLIVLRIPYFRGEQADIPYTTIPLGIIINTNIIITICKMKNDIINDFAAGRVRGLSTAKKNRFILQILLKTANSYLKYLHNINRTIDMLEDKLQVSMRNEEVLELLKYQKSLVLFSTALKSNELVMERLQQSQLFKMYPDDEDLLEDVLIENQQAIEMTTIASNILSQMMDAFASIISNNLNVVMKFLASVTVVLMLPTLVASIYGMNIKLPLQDLPYAFHITMAISFGMSLLIAIIFVKRDWF